MIWMEKSKCNIWVILFSGGDNSCGSGEDQCSSWLRMKLNYSNPTCIGTLCRTIVDLSLRRHKMRAVEVELRVDATRTLCSGMMVKSPFSQP